MSHESPSEPILPWLSQSEKQNDLTADLTPGEYVLRTLFSELTSVSERKLEQVLTEPLEKPLSKSLQRGEDIQFDQLLGSLNAVAQYCLSSLLKILFEWYTKQKTAFQDTETTEGPKTKNGGKTKGTSPDSPKLAAKLSGKEMDYLVERRDHAVDFLFCLVLIEVLKQLPVHPVDDALINHIESLAFKCFKQRSSFDDGASATNAYIIAALYAEVIGVLAQTRFHSVRKRFLLEFKENSGNTQMLVNVICGMKYLRIKLYPVEHLEETFMFLQECASLFIETRDKDKEVKYALAGVFVEILVPVAATAKRELQIPALKNFIEMLYPSALEMSKKTKHVHGMYPLVAVLLCVSQKQYFLTHWPFLLSSCLANIKHRDAKMQRVCLECLYRMLWVYVIRIRGENNSTTLSRLRSVTDTLFPRGSRAVNPRDIPLTIFVKIVHFISHYNLDFAMQDIIFDLLGVGRQLRQIHPERMNIGLRAFLVIVDSLQKKEGDPAMPNTTGTLPSGSSLRVKKSFLNKPLTEDAAKDLGISKYYHSVCKALSSILTNLDLQVGRPLMKNNPQCFNKEPYDMITGDRKPKIDLFRTSVASIPRLIPNGMSRSEVVGLLSRLTIHVDEELRCLAFSSLQSLIIEFVDWREEVIVGFVNFIMREVQDFHAASLDNALRMVLKIVTQWKTLITMCESERKNTVQQDDLSIPMTAIHCIEGCGLAMLCSVRQIPRKLALLLLKEARVLGNLVTNKTGKERFVMDIVDHVVSDVLSKTVKNIDPDDKSLFGTSTHMDLQWFVDRLPSGFDTETGESGDPRHNDLWCTVLAQLLIKQYIPDCCPIATQFSWQFVHVRMFCVYSLIDQSPSGMDSLTSLGSVYSRATKKVFNLSDIFLWQNYLMFACTVHPSSTVERSSCETDNGNSVDDSKSEPRPPSPDRVECLFRFAVTLVRNDSSELRQAAVTCLGNVSPISYKEFLEELQVSLLPHVLEKRAESLRKRKKRDTLRTYLARIFELNAEHGCFRESSSVLTDEAELVATFVDYIENTRVYFSSGEADKDPPAVHQLKLNFTRFVYKMIKSIPYAIISKGKFLAADIRAKLFALFCSWCSTSDTSPSAEKMGLLSADKISELRVAATEALCSVLCCGPIFDQEGLSATGYFYQWIEYVLNPNDEKINMGQETMELLLDLNDNVPALLGWVIDKCYTGTAAISNTCFQALTAVMIRRAYPCKAITVIAVVLLKTSSADSNERELAVQALQVLERRFLSYCVPSLSSYSKSPHEISTWLANYHPELTIPLLAELSYRFEIATFTLQRTILKYMHSWLTNVQLVDITANKTTVTSQQGDDFLDDFDDDNVALPHVEMTDSGWGSDKATQLVLNNLFFLTVKYAQHFNSEFEELWGALSNAWVENNHAILTFLNILAGIGAHPDFLPHAKRLALYLVRANKESTIQTLMEELQLTEPVAHQYERSDEAPYYSITVKDHSLSLNNDGKTLDNKENDARNVKDDVLDVNKIDIQIEALEKSGSIESEIDSLIASDDDLAIPDTHVITPTITLEELFWAKQWMNRVHTARRKSQSHFAMPLPLPPSGIFFAKLSDVLPPPQTVTPLYRCNFALILLSEIVTDQARINWLPHLPLMLHVVFLGLDHSKSLIHEHCKSLLINLAVVVILEGNYLRVANSLLMFKYSSMHGSNTLGYPSSVLAKENALLLPRDENEINTANDTKESSKKGLDDKVNWLILFLTQSEGKQLWNFEDITARYHEIRSATELTTFLLQVLELFDHKFPNSDIRGSWARVASKWAISCSSRHYAGRSFQVLRALSVQLTWSVLTDILSRLTESVGDNNEDMQGYVMEILLTLDSVIEQNDETSNIKIITANFPEIEIGGEVDDDGDNEKHLLVGSSPEQSSGLAVKKSAHMIRHIRSLSSGCDLRGRFHHYLKGEELSPKMRSASLQSLRFCNDGVNTLSKNDLLSRIFWVSVSLLESDYEHEFIMAVKLLNKVLKFMDLSHKSTLERLESIFYKLKWLNFPGVQMLLLKGLTSSATSAVTIQLISDITPFSTISIMDSSEYTGLALNILAILPYMIQRFGDPGQFCLTCAATISQVCMKNNMANLGKLFTMYNQGTYHKTVEKWTKAICQYIFEFYRQSIRPIFALLTELLERGPQVNQNSVLNITCSLMNYVDFKLLSTRHILIPTLKVVIKHIKDDLWKESIHVLTLAVASSSKLEVPDRKSTSVIFDSSWFLDGSSSRLELPGKTMAFTFDFSTGCNQDVQELYQKNQSDTTGWRRPQVSQRRTKEKLVSVLHVCGHHIGLKQSPSVVFSSSSDLIVEKLTSEHSSSEENQGIEGESKEEEETNEAQQLIGVFTDFDFLDDEINEHDDDISGFGWDLPNAEYNTTPDPVERSRNSPLSGSEPDIVAACRLDTSDEEDEISRSLNTTVSPCISLPLTQEALRVHNETEGFSPVRQFTPPTDSSNESLELGLSRHVPRIVTSVLNTADVDEEWKKHLSHLVNDAFGSHAVNTFTLLALLFKHMRRNVNEITRECCTALDNSLFGVTSLFLEILETLDTQGSCPYVFLDSDTVKRSKIVERQKFMALEIDDHYRSYKMMYDNTTRALERLKTTPKPSSDYPSSNEGDMVTKEDSTYEGYEISLCWVLYKLHFQVLLFLDSYARLFEYLQKQCHKAEIPDLTSRVTIVQNEVVSTMLTLKRSSPDPYQDADHNENHTFKSIIDSIVRNLHTSNTEFAIRTLFSFREKLNTMAGFSDMDDTEMIVALYAKYLVEKKSGIIAMSKPEFTLSSISSELKEMTIHLLSVIEQLGPSTDIN